MESYEQQLNQLREKGLLRSLSEKDNDGRINFSSNDYLGLSHHPEVAKAALKAIQTFGAGGTSSRLLAGTLSLHRQLEEALAAFLKKEKAVVFSSGYHTNTGVIPVVVKPGDVIFVDRLCHASIVDGIKLSGARFYAFDHNDTEHLESLMRKNRWSYKRAVIITEGIFSMDGDTPPLLEIVYLARRWEALVYLDEAHSLGVMGPDGRGFAASLDLVDGVDIHVGTLSKTLGSHGGFVACKKVLADLLISESRAFKYTTALAPPNIGAALKALELLPGLEERRVQLKKESDFLRRELRAQGANTLQSTTQIIPVWTGSVEETKKLSDYLLKEGFFVPSIRPPTVPVGEGRVRLSVCRDIQGGPVQDLLDAFKEFLTSKEKGRKEIAQTR